MLPASAFAEDEYGDIDADEARNLIAGAPCSVPSATANTGRDVAIWLRTWLDGIDGLSAALGGRVPSQTLDLRFMPDFGMTPAVDGTPTVPRGKDGSMPFVVAHAGSGISVEKTCAIDAADWKPLVVEGGVEGRDYAYQLPDPGVEGTGELLFFSYGSYTVTMAAGVAKTNHRIRIGAGATVTLRDVRIDATGTGGPPVSVALSTATIVLEGESTLKTDDNGIPALLKDTGHRGDETLTIKGEGSLVAEGGWNAAGIGGAAGQDAANIRIEGGTVTVTGRNGAGIGGGYNGSGSNITVSGGTVTATGGNGAGIGGGNGASGSGISVSGGTVNATSIYGAGIGGGDGASGSGISVSGGTVNATSNGGAGIGGGDGAPSSGISVSGGDVTAKSNGAGAGIGGGAGGSGSGISVSGGDVTATGDEGAGIGGGRIGSAENVAVSGGTVNATSNGGAGIGGGAKGPIPGGSTWVPGGSAKSVAIEGGAVTASGYVGIGAGNGGTAKVSISGGTVRAAGEGSNPGIGATGTVAANDSLITVSGGSVDATMRPTPRYKGKKLRRVEFPVAPGTVISHKSLTYPAQVPTYYGLTDVVPVDGKLHLWLDEGIELRTDGSAAGGPFEVTLTPGEGATLAADARLEATELEPTLRQIQLAAGGIDLLKGAEVVYVPSMDRMETRMFDPATVGSGTYRVGDVVDAGSGKKYLVHETNHGPNVADMSTGEAYSMIPRGEGVYFDLNEGNNAYNIGVPQEVKKAVSINGVEYLERYACSGADGEYTVLTHFIYTLEEMPGGGRAAGYYQEYVKDGAVRFLWGFFNEGRDPQSLKDAGADASALSPAGQVTLGGRHFSLYAFGHDVSAPGVQNPSGALQTRYVVDGAGGRFANAPSADAHFPADGGVEYSYRPAVRTEGGRAILAASYEAGSLSPFVTLVAVENDLDIPVKSVGAGPAPSTGDGTSGSGQKALAPTGDGTAAPAASLAALALAAAAALALGRRRDRA